MPTTDDRDRSAVATLLRYFRPTSGRWKMPTGENWQPALALEAVLNTYQRTGDTPYRAVVEASFARYRGRRSRFYDDDGWYLNAWLRAYDVTSDVRYLDEAKALFADLTLAWDDVCGGGLWWSRDRGYKNAITNELYLLAAAKLHRHAPNGTGPGSYYDWALREWAWFEGSGMINESHAVNDGLRDCVNNGGTTWTYNQGVILGGLVELWRVTGNRAHLSRAHEIARACIAEHADADGVLIEPCEPAGCDGDQLIFKGVFAQGLARLHHADPVAVYRAFLSANADRLWAGRDRLGRLGLSWRGRPDRRDAATHTSGTLLLGVIALLDAGMPP